MDILELHRIVFLLTDDNFRTELKTFRRSYQRLKVRLRNNQLNAHLKQLKTLIHRLEVDYPVKLFQQYRDTEPTEKQIVALIKYLDQFIRKVDTILVKALAAYCISQPHFRVGHLLQHYLVVRSSLARLIYCYKALLVYSVDLYYILYAQNLIHGVGSEKKKNEKGLLLTDVEALDILTKHNCKPKPQVTIEPDSPEIVEESIKKKVKLGDNIGELIDRDTMRPVRSCRNK